MTTPLDALEALLQFRKGPLKKRSPRVPPHGFRLAGPVPNPLDPGRPNVIEGDAPTPIARWPARAFPPEALKPLVPNPLAGMGHLHAMPTAISPTISPDKALIPRSTQSAPMATQSVASAPRPAQSGSFSADAFTVPAPAISQDKALAPRSTQSVSTISLDKASAPMATQSVASAPRSALSVAFSADAFTAPAFAAPAPALATPTAISPTISPDKAFAMSTDKASAPMATQSAASAPRSAQGASFFADAFAAHASKAPAPAPARGTNKPRGAPGAGRVRADRIRDALESAPQRGKKRGYLSELEREELVRTRNRAHARSTRMKKKARFQELEELERKFLLLKEREELNQRRRRRLVELVEGAGDSGGGEGCPHSSRLAEIAARKIHKAAFSVTDAVALTVEDSGMVRVVAGGLEMESGEPATMSGVVCADFAPKTADISAVSLSWAATTGGIPPSVSVLSFQSQRTSGAP